MPPKQKVNLVELRLLFPFSEFDTTSIRKIAQLSRKSRKKDDGTAERADCRHDRLPDSKREEVKERKDIPNRGDFRVH